MHEPPPRDANGKMLLRMPWKIVGRRSPFHPPLELQRTWELEDAIAMLPHLKKKFQLYSISVRTAL